MLYSLIVYTVGMTKSLQTQKDIKCTWKKKRKKKKTAVLSQRRKKTDQKAEISSTML